MYKTKITLTLIDENVLQTQTMPHFNDFWELQQQLHFINIFHPPNIMLLADIHTNPPDNGPPFACQILMW